MNLYLTPPTNKSQNLAKVWPLFFLTFFLLGCAGKKVLSKKSLVKHMDRGNNDELIQDFEKNHWRLYTIKGQGEFTGKDIANMFRISDKCRSYYVAAHEKLFVGGAVNPRLAQLPSATIMQIINQYEKNIATVCGELVMEEGFQKTELSEYFFEVLYPNLYEEYKDDVDELRYVYRKQQQAGY